MRMLSYKVCEMNTTEIKTPITTSPGSTAEPSKLNGAGNDSKSEIGNGADQAVP